MPDSQRNHTCSQVEVRESFGKSHEHLTDQTQRMERWVEVSEVDGTLLRPVVSSPSVLLRGSSVAAPTARPTRRTSAPVGVTNNKRLSTHGKSTRSIYCTCKSLNPSQTAALRRYPQAVHLGRAGLDDRRNGLTARARLLSARHGALDWRSVGV